MIKKKSYNLSQEVVLFRCSMWIRVEKPPPDSQNLWEFLPGGAVSITSFSDTNLNGGQFDSYSGPFLYVPIEMSFGKKQFLVWTLSEQRVSAFAAASELEPRNTGSPIKKCQPCFRPPDELVLQRPEPQVQISDGF